MGTRRRARECALQLLYMWEFLKGDKRVEEQAFADYWEDHPEDKATKEFAERLVRGVIERQEEVDNLIRRASLNWRIDRMATVDRNVLRLATYELLAVPETPMKVVLNEAIELSKRYGTEDSGAFVNGVLDKVATIIREEINPQMGGAQDEDSTPKTRPASD